MAEQLHTEEPWFVEIDWENDHAVMAGKRLPVASLFANTDKFNKENARRIVACVNVLAGISTEELEEQISYGRLIKLSECKACSTQSELLEVLYKALPFVEDHEDNKVYKPGAVLTMLKEIREAIAKAEAVNG
jgi:hypothetical protein